MFLLLFLLGVLKTLDRGIVKLKVWPLVLAVLKLVLLYSKTLWYGYTGIGALRGNCVDSNHRNKTT